MATTTKQTQSKTAKDVLGDLPAKAEKIIKEKQATGVWFTHGQKVVRSRPYSLAWVALEHTKNISGPAHLSTDALRGVLADLGVADPKVPGWQVTLPNGVHVAYLPEGQTPTDVPDRPARATRRATEKSGGSNLDLAKQAAAVLKEAGRYSGARKITITKENMAQIAGSSVEQIQAMEPTSPEVQPDVTPITKASQTRKAPAAKKAPATRKAPVRKATTPKATAAKKSTARKAS